MALDAWTRAHAFDNAWTRALVLGGARSLAPGEVARHWLVERMLVSAWRRRSDARLGLEKRRELLCRRGNANSFYLQYGLPK